MLSFHGKVNGVSIADFLVAYASHSEISCTFLRSDGNEDPAKIKVRGLRWGETEYQHIIDADAETEDLRGFTEHLEVSRGRVEIHLHEGTKEGEVFYVRP